MVTLWTGSVGSFQQSLEVADADGSRVSSGERPFRLATVRERRLLRTTMPLPADPGEYSLVATVDGVLVSEQIIVID